MKKPKTPKTGKGKSRLVGNLIIEGDPFPKPPKTPKKPKK